MGWDIGGLIGGANAARGSNEQCCSLADTFSATSRKAGLIRPENQWERQMLSL